MCSSIERAFDPWIGHRYQTEGLNGASLLILGESQYDTDLAAPLPGLRERDGLSTHRIVQDWGIDRPNAFFTKIIKLVSGQLQCMPTQEDKARFWDRVVFYNYVQWWMPGPRSRPSQEMWQSAQGPFLRVLEECQPQIVLVLGKALAGWLPPTPGDIGLIRIAHPSSKGFRYGEWIDRIREALPLSSAASSPSELTERVSLTEESNL